MSQMVSVVMVVYNGERFLEAAIASVSNQTHRDFELVVVDDGSSDQTPEILARLAISEPRIVIIQQKNHGVASARNRALRAARYELIACIDADDRMLPNRLERQLCFISAHSEASVICSHAYLINTSNQRIGKSQNAIELERGIKQLSPGCFLEIIHSSVLMRKKDVCDVGCYREYLRYAEDRDLWGRMATNGKQIMCQPELLVEYRLHGGAMTMMNVFTNPMTVRTIDHNVVQRLKGKPELSETEVTELLRARPLWARLNEQRRFVSIRFYKNATRKYAENKKLSCLVAAGVASMLAPVLSVRRITKKFGWY